MVSGLRQAMAICIFLGLVLPFYLEKKWIQYVIGVLIAASFHKVGYGWLVLVIAYYIPVWGMVALTGVAMVVGLIIQIPVVEQLILGILPSYHMTQFLTEGSMSLFAVGERVVSFAVLLMLYIWLCRQKEEIPKWVQQLFKSIYLWCLLLYVDVRECLLCQPLCDNLQGCGVCGGSRTCGMLSEF